MEERELKVRRRLNGFEVTLLEDDFMEKTLYLCQLCGGTGFYFILGKGVYNISLIIKVSIQLGITK